MIQHPTPRLLLLLLAALIAPVFLASPAGAAPPSDPGRLIERIAFGSCNRANLDQFLWRPILENNPDLWIWLGDNVYGSDGDPEDLERQFALQKKNPGYAELLARVPVIGTWDDHDYGINDGGRDYPHKARSQRTLLDFLDEPQESPRRAREGVYASYLLGPEGRRVKIILLDGRTHRDRPDTGGDVLGEEQWRWLESELLAGGAQIHLIASGTQVLPEEQPFEKWAQYPDAKRRLLDLVARAGHRPTILLSGDRHLAEITRLRDPAFPGDLYEVTASGMTHHAVAKQGDPRLDFANEKNRNRVAGPLLDYNFGLVRIDWSGERPAVRIELRDRANALRLEAETGGAE